MADSCILKKTEMNYAYSGEISELSRKADPENGVLATAVGGVYLTRSPRPTLLGEQAISRCLAL